MSLDDIYQGHELPPNTKRIRVLDILPVSDPNLKPDSEPINCTFVTIDLDDCPRFTALSYVWGRDPPASQTFIICEGVQVPVTNNCRSALRHLRQKLGRFSIWVDAVCIKQTDLAEKVQQIPLMGDIYSSAESVYIWLGDGTPGSDRAMRYLADNSFEKYFKMSRPVSAALSICFAPWNLLRCPLPLPRKSIHLFMSGRVTEQRLIQIDNQTPRAKITTYTTISDLEELFDRPWITRVWTYQEILLATNPVVVCGNVHATWSQVECSLGLFAQLESLDKISASWHSVVRGRAKLQSSNPTTQKVGHIDHKAYTAYMKKVWKARYRIELSLVIFGSVSMVCCLSGIMASFSSRKIGVGISLVCVCILTIAIFMIPAAIGYSFRDLSLLNKLRREAVPTTNDLIKALYSLTATNPKDMAFGMWAVLEKLSSSKLGSPNYNCHIGEIYRNFTIHVIRVTGALDSIFYAAARPLPEQPSWVPDWTAHDRNGWIGLTGKELATDDYGNDVVLRVEHDIPPDIIVHLTQLAIVVQSYIVATLSSCSIVRKTGTGFEANERDIHLGNLRWLDMQNEIDQMTSGHAYQWPSKRFRRSRDTFLCWRGDKDPAQTLTSLEGIEANPDLNDVIQAHFHGFSTLAKRVRRTSFIAKYAGARAMSECSGVCSSRAKVGDLIIRVQGLQQLLVARSCQGPENSIQIISPALLNKFSSKHQQTLGKFHEPQRRYEEFHSY